MKARLFNVPSRPTVEAGAEPGRGGGHHDPRTARVRANLVDVAIDVDRGLPGCATVHRSRDTADMDIGEQHRAVRGRGYGPDPERRSDEFALYHFRACVPLLAPGHSAEAPEFPHPSPPPHSPHP